MSQVPRTTFPAVDRDEWNSVLAQLRADGFSPAESIKVTRAVLHVSLGEAKQIVHASQAWSSERAVFETLHESVETVATDL